jgi:hypothetical protein
MNALTPLKEIAKVIRSKNAGPFEITFDIIFRSKDDYRRFKEANVLTKGLFCTLYNVSPAKIITFGYFDILNAVKATIPRPRPQGSVGETDMHAAQQHAPLLDILVPWPRES